MKRNMIRTVEKMKEIPKEYALKASEITELSGMIRGGSDGEIKAISIAHDYGFEKGKRSAKIVGVRLSRDEVEFLELYRSLDEKQRSDLEQFINGVITEEELEKRVRGSRG